MNKRKHLPDQNSFSPPRLNEKMEFVKSVFVVQ